jgi:hypothetical protein
MTQASSCRHAMDSSNNNNNLYHKCHIDKVMFVAFAVLAYDRGVENGGKSVKLGFYRVQGARVAKNQVKERE